MRILLVEDTEDVAWPIQRQLERDGHAVDCAASRRAAEDMLAVQSFDLILLDINLPDGSGVDILRNLRSARDSTPVLVLTARQKVQDRISALDLGADDYLVKPFDLHELAARVRALLRRAQGRAGTADYAFGALRYDPSSQKVTVHGEAVTLTRRELSLLEIFLSYPDRALSKEELHAKLFRFDEESSLNAVELYVGRLRRKLAGSGVQIRTRWGIGYQIELGDEA
jgi:two-component system, OmpR family, response regulator TctD